MVVIWLALGCSGGVEAPTPNPEGPVPTLEVRPNVKALPVNAVSFQLSFSEPMGSLPDQSAVFRNGRKQADLSWERTWDATGRTCDLTIKGLDVGGTYDLSLIGFRSKQSVPIVNTLHSFRTVEPDLEAPSGVALQVESEARPGGRQSVRVTFPEPMNFDVLQSITVLGGASPWPGTLVWAENQTVAVFAPEQDWDAQPIRVSFSAGIRDLAGHEMVDKPAGMVIPTRAD